jgi:hypothetical protein
MEIQTTPPDCIKNVETGRPAIGSHSFQPAKKATACLRGARQKITAKFAASALNVTRLLKLRQNLLQKFDGEILS